VTGVEPDGGELTAIFDGRSVTYGFGELDTLVPAYAATIHKSQGSEYPAVVIPVVTQHYPMLQRNLLYTGVTRGKRLVVLVDRTEDKETSPPISDSEFPGNETAQEPVEFLAAISPQPGALEGVAIGEWTRAIRHCDALNRSCLDGPRQRPWHCPGTSCGASCGGFR
jgi:UvrD-like helicase C-terminal domain